MCTSDVASDYKSHRFPLFQKANSRIIPKNWASEAICGAVVSYFELDELEDHLSRNTESSSSEYLQRTPSFWLFAAACYAGDLELLCDTLADLQIRFEPMGGSGA